MSVRVGSTAPFGLRASLWSRVALAASSRARQQPKEYGVGGGARSAPGTSREFASNVGDMVHFDIDSHHLTGEAQRRSPARRNGSINIRNTVTIEGHADERGTREYNIALGARRATAVPSIFLTTGVIESASGRCRSARSGRCRSAGTSPAGRRIAGRRPSSTTAR